jgi:hypothetical protein
MSLENYANLRRARPRRTSSYDRTGGNIIAGDPVATLHGIRLTRTS